MHSIYKSWLSFSNERQLNWNFSKFLILWITLWKIQEDLKIKTVKSEENNFPRLPNEELTVFEAPGGGPVDGPMTEGRQLDPIRKWAKKDGKIAKKTKK